MNASENRPFELLPHGGLITHGEPSGGTYAATVWALQECCRFNQVAPVTGAQLLCSVHHTDPRTKPPHCAKFVKRAPVKR